MSGVVCECGERIACWPKSPLRVVRNDDGEQVVPTDYTPVYEHVRDNHPELWTEGMANEFENHKAGRV